MQPLLGYAPLEVGREGGFLVGASEVGNNGAIFHVFLASSCNCEVSGGWVAGVLDLIVQGQTITGISHRAL